MKKRKLRIAQIAPLWFSIPPKKYGGTEKIIYYLTNGLVKDGYKVTLFASSDSKTLAKNFSITKKSLISQNIPWSDWWWNNFNYSIAFEKANEFDILHSHWTPLGMYFQNLIKKPVLHTFHNLPPKKDLRWQILSYYKNSNVVFISKSEKKNSPVKFKREYVVYNGIDINKFKFKEDKKDFFIWVGRIVKKKGIENAILIAKKTNIKLFLIGPLQEMEKKYFKEKIKPNLNRKIKYLGELTEKELIKIYQKAKRNIELFDFDITMYNKDISKGIREKNVDLIFLDLENPEKIVKKAYKSLKPGGWIVSFDT